MQARTTLIIAALLLPLIVAAFDWSFLASAGAVGLLLLIAWALTLRTMLTKQTGPEIILETITMSHFAEKARWALDRLGIDYVERPWMGTIGAFYLGRTVPKLYVRTGSVWSTIGNSSDILRYLWGRYANEPNAGFLEPTPARLELEQRLDRIGVMLQVWIYYHALDDAGMTLRAWGIDNPRVPSWQKGLSRVLYPVQRFLLRRSFRINENNYARACHSIEELLNDIDLKLSDGRKSILGGDTPNYTDFAFASMMGLWLQPPAYAGADGPTAHIDAERRPEPMRKDIERWREDHPKSVAFVEGLYAEHR